MSNPTELPDLDRAAFEAAWRAKYDMPSSVQFSTFSDGRYQAPALNDFYEGWCMARRAQHAESGKEMVLKEIEAALLRARNPMGDRLTHINAALNLTQAVLAAQQAAARKQHLATYCSICN